MHYVLIFIILLLWGFWTFLPKLAVEHLSPTSIMVHEAFAGILLSISLLASGKIDIKPRNVGSALSVLAGACAYLGILFYAFAVSSGEVSIVAPLTGLYPIITALLGVVILRENFSIFSLGSVICAVIAVWLLTV